ncbi:MULTISPECIES: hypothetical protein [Streptomyces]|uniref:hypothetical protein n=1 Tax=Streptomyces TaxID=1883 RepID=UPI0029A20D3C|nr:MULTISPECIES: hypothetical protein [unclassified Streptomyces]MDX2921216.1 hypothetical protein [Streptomyces sp. NE06-03C]MDX3609503.1 hypothetical protein [Streptomyces sp. FL06-04B]MDX3735425.1 hypothetical protein [Streptomyces sp. ID01-15D]
MTALQHTARLDAAHTFPMPRVFSDASSPEPMTSSHGSRSLAALFFAPEDGRAH